MKHKFEIWIEDQGFDRETRSLLEEAILCYKAGAYRGALLFSYTGFMTVLRRRCLEFRNIPSGLAHGEWNHIQNQLRSHEQWDKELFTLTQKQDRNPFVTTDEMRKQIAYWKDRRNDAAHAKSNQISYALIETFWSFFESVLPKLVINGGLASMIDRAQKHFDNNFTKSGLPPSEIARDLDASLLDNEVSEFLDAFAASFENHGVFTSEFSLFNEILTLSSDRIKIATIAWLKEHVDLLISFIEQFPKWFLFLGYTVEEFRPLWRSILFSKFLRDDWTFFCKGLDANLIPKDEEIHSFERTLSNTIGTPNKGDVSTLLAHGYYDYLDQIWLFKNDFDWFNAHRSLLVHRLSAAPLNRGIVERICDQFDSTYHPFELRDAIRRLLEKDVTFTATFKAIAEQEPRIELPTILFPEVL